MNPEKGFTLPRVYPITDPEISTVSHLEQVRRLIAGGAKLIQLRDKHSSPGDFFTAAELAVAYAHQSGVRVIINDRVDIALATGADGVHLGQEDLPPDAARRVLGERAIIGFSTHNVEQAKAAIQFPVDYIAAGPIFATSSKANPDPPIGLEGLAQIRSIVGRIPLVAIGGLDAALAPGAINAGADSVALISALLKGDIQARTEELIKSLL
jgi:thiamine-phosphate pyrophosphorylase